MSEQMTTVIILSVVFFKDSPELMFFGLTRPPIGLMMPPKAMKMGD